MLRGVVSQTPTEPASPRVLARARARGDLPYANEWTFAVVLLALVVVGSLQGAAFVEAFQGGLKASLRGEPGVTHLKGLVQPLIALLAVPALVALVCMVAQRAPTLRAAPDLAGEHEKRGRPAHGRVAHALLAGFKIVVLGASLGALVYDGLLGWLDMHARSAGDLLAISGRVLPVMLMRAAWVCALLGGVELAVQYLARMRRLRMTRRQMQDEQRELAADPRMLSERRSRAAQELPARLSPQLAAAELAQLSAAALLITGASRVVAIEYSPEHGVPRVWLSAEGPHALELLSRAYQLDLPIVSDELVAAALSRLPLRASVPAEFHARVAEWLVTRGKPAAREAS